MQGSVRVPSEYDLHRLDWGITLSLSALQRLDQMLKGLKPPGAGASKVLAESAALEARSAWIPARSITAKALPLGLQTEQGTQILQRRVLLQLPAQRGQRAPRLLGRS